MRNHPRCPMAKDALGHHRCGNPATYEEGGRDYCAKHVPFLAADVRLRLRPSELGLLRGILDSFVAGKPEFANDPAFQAVAEKATALASHPCKLCDDTGFVFIFAGEGYEVGASSRERCPAGCVDASREDREPPLSLPERVRRLEALVRELGVRVDSRRQNP